MNRRDCLKSSLLLGLGLSLGVRPSFSADERESIRLRIVSYNIQIGRAPGGSYSDPSAAFLSRTADRIAGLGPDVAGLQEVDNKTERSGSDVDQLAELSRMTGLNGSFAPKTELPGGWYGIGTLSKEKPLRTSRVIMEGAYHPRALQICEFERFVFFNTHWPLKPELRMRCVDAVEAEAKKFTKPIVLVGDFNAEPDSAEIAALKRSWTEIGPNAPTFPSTGPKEQIDYVFARNADKIVVHEARVVDDPETSDHCPVFCDVELFV